jgi:signal transduction histidine kinase
MNMSLRNRLLLVTVATLGLGLGGLLVAGNLLYARTTTSSVMNLLNTRLEAQIAALDLTPHGIEARSTLNDEALDSHGWVFNGDVVIEHPTGLPAGLDRLAAALAARTLPARAVGPHDTEMTSRPLRLHGRRVGAVVVSVSSAQFTHLRHVVLAGSATMALLVLLLGALVLRRALNAALVPVEQMTASAEEWGANELDTRFHLGPARDEITGLALTLDHLLDRIAASRRHEQRFASEMAHELRTPLAAIHGHAEFAADPRSSNEEIRAAVNQITAQTTRMKQTIDALMAYARHETDAPEDGSDLASVCVEFDGVTVTAAKDLPAADAEPALVRQALSPIVENARRHAATRVWIELGRRDGLLSVCVCDDGPGVEPAIAGDVFEPGARGPGTNGGAGLGLPLAQRLARSCGGDLRLLPGSPTRFELTLPIRP